MKFNRIYMMIIPSKRVSFFSFFILLFSFASCYSSDELLRSTNYSAEYINNFTKPDGRFAYEVNMITGKESYRKYNILRHAGTIYALSSYYMKYKNKESLNSLTRATKFLQDCCIKPLPDNDELLAVWSLKSINKSMPYDQLKLGGTGLGLVALLNMEKIKPGTTDSDTLKKLGDFIIYMQKEDGSFYSKYIPSTVGRDDSWTSLYYPGEAALGLVMLYEYDPQPKWFNHAVKVLTYLSDLRKNDTRVPHDHWALLATAKVIEISEKDNIEIPRDKILSHGKQIVNNILKAVPKIEGNSLYSGALTRDGRTTPTATRLEGIIVFSNVLNENDRVLKQKIKEVSMNGINYLIRAQVKEGPYLGAIPPNLIEDIGALDLRSQRLAIVRIDYVQHALSAFLDYKKFFGRLGR